MNKLCSELTVVLDKYKILIGQTFKKTNTCKTNLDKKNNQYNTESEDKTKKKKQHDTTESEDKTKKKNFFCIFMPVSVNLK